MLFNSSGGAKFIMNDAVIKVICVCFALSSIVTCLATPTSPPPSTESPTTTTTTTTSTPSAIDNTVNEESSKNLTVRSISDGSNADETPLRINLAANILAAAQSQKEKMVSDKSSDKVTSAGGATATVYPSNTQTISSKSKVNKDASLIGHKVMFKEKSDPYECPNTTDFTFFPSYCTNHADCIAQSREMRCCRQFNSKRCVKGVPKPLKEQRHEPILGLIPRKCPKEPLAELFWELKTCNTDHDCWPRICCPDGSDKYCRSARPEFDSLPVGRSFAYPIDTLSGYLQCTPPPPADYDPNPKVCNNTLDCFPNVCCQEAGKKHCRPPKRSLLAFLTTFAQRFNTGIIKQWTDNLVIRRR